MEVHTVRDTLYLPRNFRAPHNYDPNVQSVPNQWLLQDYDARRVTLRDVVRRVLVAPNREASMVQHVLALAFRHRQYAVLRALVHESAVSYTDVAAVARRFRGVMQSFMRTALQTRHVDVVNALLDAACAAGMTDVARDALASPLHTHLSRDVVQRCRPFVNGASATPGAPDAVSRNVAWALRRNVAVHRRGLRRHTHPEETTAVLRRGADALADDRGTATRVQGHHVALAQRESERLRTEARTAQRRARAAHDGGGAVPTPLARSAAPNTAVASSASTPQPHTSSATKRARSPLTRAAQYGARPSSPKRGRGAENTFPYTSRE